jgi:hypothetical protein
MQDSMFRNFWNILVIFRNISVRTGCTQKYIFGSYRIATVLSMAATHDEPSLLRNVEALQMSAMQGCRIEYF